MAGRVALAALTAWQGLFEHGGLKAGQKVLIHGESGGVGCFAVQFAKWRKGLAIGTSSGLIDAGTVFPVNSRVFPLKEAATAHRIGELGHTPGKMVLQVVE